jgi:RND superfamily putative drug exporter
MQPSRNLAARAGRWSARHWKTAVAGWVAFVVLAFMVGGNVGTKSLEQEESGVRDSGAAAKLVHDHFPEASSEMVLITSTTAKAGSPEFRAAVHDRVEQLRATPGVQHVQDPYSPETPDAISADERAVMVSFEIPGDPATSAAVQRTVDQTEAATKKLDDATPHLKVEQLGDASSEADFDAVFEKDLAKAGMLSLPLTLLILIVTFGTLLAAGIPLLLAVSAVVATFGLIGPVSQLMPVEDSIRHVVLLIGLAVGVDYSLFYVRRLREERAAGRSKEAALEAAAATSGHAVLVSGLTVITAMAGMYLAGSDVFASFATGSIIVVAVAMLGSLTVLPAVLSRVSGRIDRSRIPGLGRVKARVERLGLWSRLLDRVLGRPVLSVALSAAVLIALAIPATGMQLGQPAMADSLPQDEPVVQTFNRLQDAFPQERSSLSVVVKAADVTAPEITAALERTNEVAQQHEEMFPAGTAPSVDVSPDHRVATMSLTMAGDSTDDVSQKALDVLRDDVVPETMGGVDGATVLVDGQTAQDRDFNDQMVAHLPLVFGFVLVSAFLLLLVTFRSVVVPVKAIVLNLMSVAAAYGAMVLVFQHGWLKGLLGFSETGPIVAWLPMFLFVVLFGLSMDYHVFILSRVRELVDRGEETEVAVATAIKRTAGTVTSAAVVMVGVFALFGSLSFIVFKQLGVGLAFAVLLDATLVRGVLLPATMKLLGRRNWWLPRSLGWLPTVGEPELDRAPARA